MAENIIKFVEVAVEIVVVWLKGHISAEFGTVFATVSFVGSSRIVAKTHKKKDEGTVEFVTLDLPIVEGIKKGDKIIVSLRGEKISVVRAENSKYMSYKVVSEARYRVFSDTQHEAEVIEEAVL